MSAETMQMKTPGVYIKGSPPTPHPPVPSGITGFVGVCGGGPFDLPTPIANWGEFLERFGGFVPYGDLPHAVYGFFLNGGQLCYVVRVGRRDPEDGFIPAEAWLNDEAGEPYLRFTSKEKGSAGNGLTVETAPFKTPTALEADQAQSITVYNIKAFAGDEGQEFTITHGETALSETFTITSIDTASNRLVLLNPLTGTYPPDAVISSEDRFDLILKREDNPEPLHVFYNLGMDPAGGRYYKNVIDNEPENDYIDVGDPEPGGAGLPAGAAELTGGKDPGRIDYRYYTGYEYDGNAYFDPGGVNPPLGLAALEDILDVSLVAVPGLERGEGDETYGINAAQSRILYHCRKMGERFAILDPPGGVTPGDILKEPSLVNFDDKDAKFGALYFPRVYCVTEGENRLTPPSGFIAGVMASTDRQSGTHKAPANEKIKGVVNLEHPIGMSQQDDLNEAGINCIRKFEDGKIKVWGARTLSKEKKWRYVSVRRTYLNIIKILPKKLLWAVFEPNDKTLWKRIQSSLTSFFLGMTARGVTAGSRPAEAFYVKCNEETNPKEVVDAGQVIAEIGIALSAPAEFIVITVKKTPESLGVIEEEV
jgi:hypothetical protein